MKKLAVIILLLSLIIIGCSENEQITSPNSESEIQKTTNPEDPSYLDTESAIKLDTMPEWLCMPVPSSATQVQSIYASKWILNNNTNNLIIDTSYSTGVNSSVGIHLKLTFTPGVLPSDSLFVTAEVDIQNGTIKFGPPTVFNEPLRLDYKISGLDFSSLDPNLIRFIYSGEDGTIEPVNCWYYEIKEAQGSIQMWWGEIPHFSRYGFVR